MAGRCGALSIKPSEGSRSRVRWTRPMDFQSIFGWKSLPEAGFGKNVVIEADRCSDSRIHLDHPNAGRSVVQDHSSDHRFKRLHLTRASVRRVSGFVLTGNSEVTGEDGPTTRHRSRLLTGSVSRSVGLGAMFTRRAISPIEVVGCATVPQEPVQSDSTNRGLLQGDVRFDSLLDLVK